MDLKNKAELEKYFAHNFDTVLFPVLADIYKTEGDLGRARKVCEIGLEYHPANVEGSFILAEVNQLEGDLLAAERLLKNVLAVEPLHYRAAVSLAQILTKLERSPDSIARHWRRVAKINPTHPDVIAFFKPPSKPRAKSVKKAKAVTPKKPVKKSATKVKPKERLKATAEGKKIPANIRSETTKTKEEILAPKPPSIKPQEIKEEELQSLDISPRMATFTMVNVLKKQKLYQQAISVLEMLEEKGADSALINQERQNLEKLIEGSE